MLETPVHIHFRLSENQDPEERLEEAALWKAMKDEYGCEIEAITGLGDPEVPTFGRGRRNPFEPQGVNPVRHTLDYWNDPAFLDAAQRDFKVLDYDDTGAEVERLHTEGKGAFIKSTRQKHLILNVPIGENFTDVMDDYAYSFIDGGPKLMVQEFIIPTYEHRFFVIDRKVVTDSPIQWSLTPLDTPLSEGSTFKTPNSQELEIRPDFVNDMRALAEDIAGKMRYPHASVDLAIVNGRAVAIELNPMCLGNLGLYAADVRALAAASRSLLNEFKPHRIPIESPAQKPKI